MICTLVLNDKIIWWGEANQHTYDYAEQVGALLIEGEYPAWQYVYINGQIMPSASGDYIELTLVLADKIVGCITCPTAAAEAQIPDGGLAYPGHYPPHKYSYSQGEFIEVPQYTKTKRTSPENLVANLAQDAALSGFAVTASLPPNVEWTQQDACNAIDQAAGKARAAAAARGALIHDEYALLAEKVTAWLRDTSAQVPAMLAAYASSSNQSPQQAAEAIVAASSAYKNLLEQTYIIRHQGKAAVAAATADFAEAAAPYIQQLEALHA